MVHPVVVRKYMPHYFLQYLLCEEHLVRIFSAFGLKHVSEKHFQGSIIQYDTHWLYRLYLEYLELSLQGMTADTAQVIFGT